MSATQHLTAADLDRYYSCESKKRVYFLRARAETAAYHLSLREGALWCAYKCRHCDGYHVGHAPKRGTVVFGQRWEA